jgi:leader peptidase (prepilin peptidase)/N-methyltransferase
MNNLFLGIIVFLFGLVMGSFSACMGYRIPNKISTYKKRSFCPKCKKQLKWYMNIPLLSFILLKGKCAYCKEKISLFYPIVELTSGLLYLLAFEIYINTKVIDLYSFLLLITLSTAFLITAVSDFLYYYISDRVVLITLIITLVLKYIFLGFDATLNAVIAAVCMFSLMMFIKYCGDKIFKKESLGGGDIKLMGAIGAVLGFVPSLVALFVSSLLGLLFSLFAKSDDKSHIVPFGPFLLISTIICIYFSYYIDYFLEIILKIAL